MCAGEMGEKNHAIFIPTPYMCRKKSLNISREKEIFFRILKLHKELKLKMKEMFI